MGVADASAVELERTPRKCDCRMFRGERTRRSMTRISCRELGLVPVMALAERCGLADLAAEHVSIGTKCGVNAHLKVGCLVAGMAAGADSIDDMDVLRHGAMGELFGGCPGAIDAGVVPARRSPGATCAQLRRRGPRVPGVHWPHGAPLLPGADVLAFIDMDSTQKRVYGHKKQGAGFGHTKIQGKSLLVRGLNALAAVVSTPLAAPVIAAAPAARRQRELRPRCRLAWPPRPSAQPAPAGAPA